MHHWHICFTTVFMCFLSFNECTRWWSHCKFPKVSFIGVQLFQPGHTITLTQHAHILVFDIYHPDVYQVDRHFYYMCVDNKREKNEEERLLKCIFVLMALALKRYHLSLFFRSLRCMHHARIHDLAIHIFLGNWSILLFIGWTITWYIIMVTLTLNILTY